MRPFLQQVANFLFQNYSSELDKISLVFPSRRSGVFFNAYLNELVERPAIGPEILTIDDFISGLSDLQISDQIGLIMKLHKVYQDETGHYEELDEFYFWGEILLNDFNDIDKYLLDAKDLFQNIADIKEIESRFDYLNPDQKKAIETFWGNLGKASDSSNKEKFMEVWNKLPAIYQRFKELLLSEGSVYSGLRYRDVVVNSDHIEDSMDSSHYFFVGFNALNACEKKIFKGVNALGKAGFFWDYDPRFVEDVTHEAGLFIRENLMLFPPPHDFIMEENKVGDVKVRSVSVSGQIAQAQVLNQASLYEPERSGHFDDTALVLADESLLMPIVSVAATHHDGINITMGYPFQDTPVYSLINLLVDLQRNARLMGGRLYFYHRAVVSVLNHQLLAGVLSRKLVDEIHDKNKIYVSASDLQCSDLFSKIFQLYKDWKASLGSLKEIIQLLGSQIVSPENNRVNIESEFVYQAYLSIQRLQDILLEYQSEKLSLQLFFRILMQHLQRISVPFEGEPLSGLQVMGVLETRNLDFKKIVIFSVNEGKLPSSSMIQSFIPYHLRKAFGLPAYEEQDAMYAYYFYRLLHRAEEVVLVYDSSTDGLNTGEVSRYLMQLQYDSECKLEEYSLGFDFKAINQAPIAIKGTPQHHQKLIERYSEKRLSPSALNTYLDCKLKFYFQNIAGLREKDELVEDVDPRLFGNLFHLAAEEIYGQFIGKTVQKQEIEALLVNKDFLGKAILKAFRKEYYKDKELEDVVLSGNNILIAEHLKMYLGQMIKNDLALAPFRLIDLEKNYEQTFELKLNGGFVSVKMGGIVDRIDETDEGVRIIDYKTGRSLKLDFGTIDELFDREKKDRRKEIMQTLVYSEILARQNHSVEIIPSIYKIDNFFDEEFAPKIKFRKSDFYYREIATEFVQSLDDLLLEIFSDSNEYSQTKDVRKCTLCPFNRICQRS